MLNKKHLYLHRPGVASGVLQYILMSSRNQMASALVFYEDGSFPHFELQLVLLGQKSTA